MKIEVKNEIHIHNRYLVVNMQNSEKPNEHIIELFKI